ncbi:protein phosphatase 1 regulatory subunit 3C-like [Dermacentor variabilis]|uniref:protein phosphatase 1 regulatory subunit 3C-like n=1 Tax=Dermacentor variabilis TaxID=34621 RepID=UPI003F5B3071
MSKTCASPSGELREFANVLNAADADSIYLYLPRNLSSCHMCAEVEEQHWEHKMKLLAGFLRRESLDSGDDDVLSMKPIPAAVGGALRGILRRDAPKTSPAWPARRRRGRLVTFADALGLELEHVRRLVHRVRTPAAPPGAAAAALEAEFSLASGDELRRRVRRDKVCLRALSVRELTLHGTVSVANLTYHKHVFVRYTANEWQSHVDWPASYVPGSLADGVDEFEFALSVADAPLRCELALCFETEDGRRFWDNNGGANYRFRRCGGGRPATAAAPRAAADYKAPCGSWLHWL